MKIKLHAIPFAAACMLFSVSSKAQIISGGINHTLVVCEDRSVYAMGYNNFAQLGDSTYQQSNTPVKVKISNVRQVAAATSHSLALKNDGTVWGWGMNDYGQLGADTVLNTEKRVPARL